MTLRINNHQMISAAPQALEVNLHHCDLNFDPKSSYPTPFCSQASQTTTIAKQTLRPSELKLSSLPLFRLRRYHHQKIRPHHRPKIKTPIYFRNLKTQYSFTYPIKSGISGTVYNAMEKTGMEIQRIAIKVSKSHHYIPYQKYEEMLIQKLNNRSIDSGNSNYVIKLKNGFTFKNNRHTAYELLSSDAYEALQTASFCLDEIKIIAFQLFTALADLAEEEILHTDIKPDNILFVRPGSLEIRLADFGNARLKEEVRDDDPLTTLEYRAPEAATGHSYDEKMDIWSTACVLYGLYRRSDLFHVKHDTTFYDANKKLLLSIGKIIGPIPRVVLLDSAYAHDFDMAKQMASLKATSLCNSLFKGRKAQDLNDQEASFLDLMEKMLILNPFQRISAKDALQHPFVSGITHAQVVSSITSSQVRAI